MSQCQNRSILERPTPRVLSTSSAYDDTRSLILLPISPLLTSLHHSHLASSNLISIQPRHRRRIINLHTPPLHLRGIPKRQPPPPLPLRRTQPQPHQMPPGHPTLRPKIAIRCPRMQRMAIRHKLNIPHLKHHMQLHTVTRLLQHPGCFDLRLRHRGDHTDVRKPR